MGSTKTNLFTPAQNSLAQICKALAHPARIAIIEHLLQTTTCVNNELVAELGLAQATVSQHLKELKALDIIQGSVEGARICYCINPKKWSEISQTLNHMFNGPKSIDTTINCC